MGIRPEPEEIERWRTRYLRLKAALHDPITTLPSYPALMSSLRTMLDERREVGVVHVEIEDLDLVESLYGWQVFDRVLEHASRILRRALGTDLPAATLLALDRVAGDRFLAFVPHRFDGQNADAVFLSECCRALRVRLGEGFENGEFRGLGPRLGFRLGHAQLSENPYFRFERRVHAAIAEAGEFPDRQRSRRDLSTAAELRRIVEDSDVSALFQAVVELESRREIGYEALARGPAGSVFERPGTMFAVSGREGIDTALDRICRDTAIRDCGRMAGDALLFVNVLPLSLEDPEWRGDPVDRLLDGSSLRRDHVILEVSERALDGHAGRACDAVEGLRDRGFRFALDDVGTGYASLEMMQALRPDFVKVDCSLVREIDAQRIKQEAMSSLLNIAGSLGADVIAEGVETEREALALQRLGVRLAQGYLFAPPLARPGEVPS